MSVTLNWNPFKDTAVDAYHVFRSITGFSIPFPNNLQVGAQLIFAATIPSRQIITLTSTDMQSVVAQINAQAKGIVASAAIAGPAAILIRCTATVNPVLKTFPCTALTQLGIQPKIYGPRQNFVDIGIVPFVSITQSYTFTDRDGVNTDWYYLKTIKNLLFSLPTVALQPSITPPTSCVIEGRVIDLSNNPIVGAEVTAQIAVQGGNHNNAGIVTGAITALTDSLGRWSMSLPQCAFVQFVIPATGYNQAVHIPPVSAALFKHLRPVNDDAWDPSGFSAGTPFQIDDGGVSDSIYGDF
jgi:hypothetical protein